MVGGSTPSQVRMVEGVPQSGMGYPSSRDGVPPGMGQQTEYLICSGRYASCIHVGGLSCFLWFFFAQLLFHSSAFAVNYQYDRTKLNFCENNRAAKHKITILQFNQLSDMLNFNADQRKHTQLDVTLSEHKGFQ